MSKKTLAVQHLTAEAAEAGASIAEMMNDVLQGDSGISDEAAILHASENIVPASPVFPPTAERLAGLIDATGAGGSGVNSNSGNKYTSPEKIIAHYDKDRYGKFQEALAHVEDAPSTSSFVGNGKDAVQVPASTRDNPQKLYTMRDKRTGRVHPIRERADKIQIAIFGEGMRKAKKPGDPIDLSERSFIFAQQSGFGQKPLVGIAQNIWHKINMHLLRSDAEKNYIEKRGLSEHPDYIFNEQVDIARHSPVVEILSTFLDEITIRALQNRARAANVSLLCCMRTVMEALCDERKVPKFLNLTELKKVDE